MGTSSLSFMLERFTHRSNGSWVGLLRASMFQAGSSEKVNHMGSNSPFRPSGHTTWSQHCKNLHSSSWLRNSQASMLGIPSIIILMCPSLDRAVCNAPLLSPVKANVQLVSILIRSVRLCATSPREWRLAWCGCVHTTTRLNTLSPLTALSGTIRINAISCLSFLCHALHLLGRGHVVLTVLSLSLGPVKGGQRLCDPHTTLDEGSHGSTSLGKCL